MGTGTDRGRGTDSNRKETKRGQTPNDYLIGIILLLLTITIALAYFPTLFQPFEEPVGSDEESMADNLASQLLADHAVPGEERTLNLTALNETVADPDDELQQIPDWMRWNVTVVDGDRGAVEVDGEPVRGGPEWGGEPAATTTRFVLAQDSDDDACEHGCRFIVRVW